MLNAIISLLSSPSSASFFAGIAEHVCTGIDIHPYTHTHKHLYPSPSKTFFWFLPGWTPGKCAFLWEGDQNCFKCHLPSAKHISLFSAVTWRKQNIKSGLKVMAVALLTFLSVGWQRLALSFSALHLYYSCNTQGVKARWEMFPVSPEKRMACHGHTDLRGNCSRQQVSASFVGYLQWSCIQGSWF